MWTHFPKQFGIVGCRTPLQSLFKASSKDKTHAIGVLEFLSWFQTWLIPLTWQNFQHILSLSNSNLYISHEESKGIKDIPSYPYIHLDGDTFPPSHHKVMRVEYKDKAMLPTKIEAWKSCLTWWMLMSKFFFPSFMGEIRKAS